MKTTTRIELRRFPLRVRDRHTGEILEESITLEKPRLHAASITGESSDELIRRLCKKQGFEVLEIGTPERQTVELDLDELFTL